MIVGTTLSTAGWVAVVLLSAGSLAAVLTLIVGVGCLSRRSLRPLGVRILLACLAGAGAGILGLPLFMLAFTGSVQLYDAPSWYFWAWGGAGVVGFPVAFTSCLSMWRRRHVSRAAA
jgi:hypothetical protein